MNKNKLSKSRRQSVRMKIKPQSSRFRLSVFRSNKHIYAQIIDENLGKTLVSASDMEKSSDDKSSSIKDNKSIGLRLAQKAIKNKIEKVYFDRGQCTYHGRIKELADGAREGGLIF
ncbi:MAG: 50S ribosomal protein L18 [Berkelbacteria bacterium GW2011_GWA2_38_9]|uniref:Large ribosomal subunit protein uL18 n=1 Tax=Berkelbacteria bacterium GW2011_GWA2_38_9 TaxID=1618334 RepID=A0A0G0L4F2_9BACT|nr:MAG: 50S ribosomal protein L18 [Berkelbacteria bacterium GW2011_GWA2_38_9]